MKNFANDQQPIAALSPVSLGAPTIDAAFGGGLVRAGLHEIYAAEIAHFGAATGFTAVLALRAAGNRPILWLRQDFLDTETGALNASGLSELGLDVERFILVRARDPEGVLRAGEQAARCSALGAVVIEPWGDAKILDFTASRRLSLASAKSSVPIFMLRAAASPSQSAAATRWLVRSAPSRALDANAPGFPAFELTLLRHRGGMVGRVWPVEWDRDRKCFQDRQINDAAPLSRPMVPVPGDRPAPSEAPHVAWRRAG
jgi:protein ImuA